MAPRTMRRNHWSWRVMCLGAAGLVAAFIPSLMAGPVGSQVPFADAKAGASATGTVVHADALQSGDTRLEDTEVAFSGAVFDTQGLSVPRYNEMRREYSASRGNDKTAYARAAALEIGLGVTPEDDNQIILAGKAEADSPPPSGPVTEEIGPVDLDPLAWASLLRGRAQANSVPDVCTIGTDLSNGAAYASDAQLLATGSGSTSESSAPTPVNNDGDGGALNSVTGAVSDLLGADSSDESAAAQPAAARPAAAQPQAAAAAEEEGLAGPLVAADADDPARAVSQSTSRTLFVPQRNAEGELLGPNFGLMGEVRQTIAPVTLFDGTDNEMTIELLGEWVLRAVATGLPGGGYVHYGPAEATPETPVARIIRTDGAENVLTLQQILGEEGLVIEIPEVAEIAIGEDPRAIGGSADSKPAIADNGTATSAAVDVVRVRALPGADPQIADVRVGHMEVRARVPAGGIECPIPVDKTPDPKSVDVGKTFTVTLDIDNPYDCTLTNVSLIDVITTKGAARFTVGPTNPQAAEVPTGTDLSSGSIGWTDLPDIPAHGSSQVTAEFRAGGGAGAIVDEATATASLGDCADDGSAVSGVDVSGAQVRGLSGKVEIPVVATEVAAAFGDDRNLPKTGAPIAVLIAMGLALVGGGSAGIILAKKL